MARFAEQTPRNFVQSTRAMDTSCGIEEGRRLSWPPPELAIVLFSFLLNYPWEMLQIPFFAGMMQIAHWEGVKQCSRATAGDALISVAAFWAGALATRSRQWFTRPPARAWTAYMLTGIAITVLFEEFATGAMGRWEYSTLMPTLPWLGTGLIPLIQWIALPPMMLWLLRRHYLGSAPPP